MRQAENELLTLVGPGTPAGELLRRYWHPASIAGVQGYSLMWPEGEPIKRFDWNDGSVVVPPERWFHQHFNTGTTPARYLALRWGSQKYPRPWVKKGFGVDESVKKGGDQIEYEDEDEDPAIRRLFDRELAKQGVISRMKAVASA